MKPPRFVPGPGQRAFVVGGSTGIGLASAMAIARAGADVALLARRPEPLAEAARLVDAAGSGRIALRVLDATDPDATRAAYESLAAELGLPDASLSFAGRALPGYFDRIGAQQLDQTLRLSVHTSWNAAQAATPLMEGRGGTIVSTSSLAGLLGVFGYTDYCAAKFAVIGLCQALRAELRPRGIAVAVLCPADTDTPGFANEQLSKPDETRAVSSSASLLSPEVVAEALLRGLRRGRFLIVPGREARLVAFAARHLPGLADLVQARQIARVGRR